MKRKIFIHIGPPKTATTTIQYGLGLNRKVLHDHGWYCPRTGNTNPKHVFHHNIARSLLMDDQYDRSAGGLTELIDEIEKINLDNFILSSEIFWRIGENNINILYKALSDFEIQIMIYLRRQDTFLQSAWSQQVKRFQTGDDYNQWLNQNWSVGNFHYHLSKWEKIFPKKNIIIRVLEKKQLFQEDVWLDFIKNCGFEEFNCLIPPNLQNRSPSIKTLEIIRYLYNHAFVDLRKPKITKLVISRMLSEYIPLHKWNEGERLNLIDRKLYFSILERYKEGNEKIARKYFNRRCLFLEPYIEAPITTFDIQSMQKNEILDLSTYFFSLIPIMQKYNYDNKTMNRNLFDLGRIAGNVKRKFLHRKR